MHSTLAVCALVVQRIIVPATPPERRAPEREIVVEAGKLDRRGTVVGLDLGVADFKRSLTLRDEKGRVVPFQVDPRGRGAFVVNLKAGSRAVYRLTHDEKPAPPPRKQVVSVDTSKVPNVLKVLVSGKPVMEYQGGRTGPRGVPEELVRNGFINPVFSPAGAVLTEAYPPDQPRHTGIWSFFKSVQVGMEKVDFWNKTTEGRIQMESMGSTWEGPIHGGFEASQIFTAIKKPLNGDTLVREKWRVTVYGGLADHPGYFLFDIESELTTPKSSQVQIAKEDLGGLAIRGRHEWTRTAGGARRLTSEPAADKHARWVYLGGKERGKFAGIAILGLPSNPGAPLPLGKGDGPDQPLLNLALNGDEAVAVVPHVPVIARYRVVAMDREPDRAVLEALWQDVATPPGLTARIVESKPVEPKPAKAGAAKQ
jgi:hypothetical protein